MKLKALGAAVVAGFVLIAAAIVAVGFVGDLRQPRVDVPDGVPPGVGAPLPAIDINAPGRTASQLNEWAAQRSETLAISVTALEAYAYAAAVMSETQPDCGIGWTTIAGIASVESKHGTYRGSTVAPDGQVSPPIRGVPLDGGPNVAEIRDTDGGVQDGDSVHDRAMGPLQFIPETWKRWGVDANGDGRVDPDNIDDAALSAARYLCARGGDLKTAEGWQAALLAYNQSGAYMRDVRDRAALYSL
ncbi:lytic transglycosylase domain-containing protein [Antrihabitans sp. NCIMB 15449]|uniref:Lytic transglycosylase domain-containing protein n=1 Tax=Antrihabitans spumae TaxID=3373370 RepID=A0ABW7JFV6_9NOCA